MIIGHQLRFTTDHHNFTQCLNLKRYQSKHNYLFNELNNITSYFEGCTNLMIRESRPLFSHSEDPLIYAKIIISYEQMNHNC